MPIPVWHDLPALVAPPLMAIFPPLHSRACAVSPTAAVVWILVGVALLASWTLFSPSLASASASAIPSFERSVYGTASVTEAGAHTDIRVETGSGGLRLRTVLDPAKTYRLAIDGRSEGDPINMRLSFDGRLDYRGSPQARDFVRISGTTDFEVLLYSDTPAVYQLATTEIEECAGACGTQADLKALVLDGTPGLASALAAGDDGLVADLLLDWAAARIPMGPGGLDTGRLSAAELYFDYFRPLERGVYCGGAADFLHKLLGLFDVPGFTVDFGTTVDALTHVTVVVADDRPGAARWRIVDPTFAMTFGFSGTTGPVSLDQILEANRLGLTDRIQPKLGDLSNRTVVLPQGAGEDPARMRCEDVEHRYSVCSLAGYGRSFDPLLMRNGFSAGLPGIFELFRRGQLHYTQRHGVPADFVAMQERFRSAAVRGDTTTVLAELPLRPVLRRPAQLAGRSPDRDELTLAELDWDPRAPARAVTIGWERCSAGGAACRDIAGAGSSRRLGSEDVGQRLRAVITAVNAYGAMTSASSLSEIVDALPTPAPAPTGPAAAAPDTSRGGARLLPARLSARTTRSHVARRSLRYTTTGRLALPRGLSGRVACRGGSVSVRVTRGATVLSRRSVRLRRDCTYRSGVVFRDLARLGRGRVRFMARFTGNDVLRPRNTRTRFVPGGSMTTL